MSVGAFFSELRRRRVFRVAGVYLVAAWALLQVATTVAPILRLPEWAPAFVMFALVLGFPVALVLAWAYDVTPGGLIRTEADAKSTAGPPSGRVRVVAYWAAAAIVALAGMAAYARFGRPRPPAAAEPALPPRSIAVLPLVNMSGDPKDDYFSDGITDEILNELAQVPGLQVTGRTSSFAYKGKNENLSEIGRALHVGAVLEGSVQRAGDTVRITAQLVDTRTDYHLWSRKYDRELKNIFAVEDEISGAIAQQLQATLVGGPEANAGTGGRPAARPATTSPRAHDLYLLGLREWNRRGSDGLRNAAAYFRQAIAEDPVYAQAYAGLAMTYALFGTYGAAPEAESEKAAVDAARKALALDNTLADAHAALARAELYGSFDVRASDAEFLRALALNPNDGTAHQWYGMSLALRGRAAEALAEGQRAVALDPLSVGDRGGYAMILYFLRDFDRAADESRRVLALGGVPAFFHMDMAKDELARHRLDLAAPELRALLDGTPGVEASDVEAVLRGLSEPTRAPAAVWVLNRWERASRPVIPPLELAELYVQLGARERALAVLSAAVRDRGPRIPFMAADALLDPLRPDPRFRALVAELRLTQ